MNDGPNIKKIAIIVIAVIGAIILASGLGNLLERVDAGEHVCIQSLSGELSWHSSPGFVWQGWGKVTRFKKSFQYWFSNKDDQGTSRDDAIKIRFNDGGHGAISGSVRIDVPADIKNLTELYTRYGTQEAIEQQLIRTVIEKAVYMSGPMLSSKESYAERRNDLIAIIEDQAVKGVYRTETKNTETIDPLTNERRKVALVDIVKKDGIPQRVEESPLVVLGIKLSNLSINEMVYDKTVESQIAEQQKAIMNVQTAIANARKAEQDAITTAKQGEAAAATAKWKQEEVNAQRIAEAEGQMKAAEFAKKAAEFKKSEQILLGEGEAARKRLVMEANGNLDAKLEVFKETQFKWAECVRDMKQPLVPTVTMGSSTTGSNSVQQLIDTMQVKAAKDLAIDFSIKK